MFGNNENGGGGGRVRSGCLDYIRSIPRSIRNHSFCRCFLVILVKSLHHYVRTAMIIICVTLISVTWLAFGEIKISTIVFVYCTALIICSGITFVEPKGYLDKKYRSVRSQQNQGGQVARQGGQGVPQGRQGVPQGRQGVPQGRQGVPQGRRGAPQGRRGAPQGRQVARPRIRHQPEDAEPLAGDLSNTVEERQAAAPECRHVQEVPFDFHHAEEPSENSNSFEPASTSSDEPLQPAAPSDSGSNLPRSSNDPSTKSTRSTPLDDIINEKSQSDEPLQQAAPSDSGSNLPRSSTDPSTQSTRSTTLDVTNEKPLNDETLQQAASSDSGSNLPRSSADPSTLDTALDHK